MNEYPSQHFLKWLSKQPNTMTSMNKYPTQQLEKSLKSLQLSESAVAYLIRIAETLAAHPEVLRACNIARFNKEASYHYDPVIGAPMTIYFHYDQDKVVIERLREEVKLSFEVYLKYLAWVDLLFGEIHPLGTIVRLDKDMLSANSVKEDETVKFVITGRRVLLEDGTYMDYAGYLYPLGYSLHLEPLLISNLFIQQVLSEGYQDDQERAYCFQQLRQAYFKKGVFSTIYQGEDDED